MTSCFHIVQRMGQNQQRCVWFVPFAGWRHRGRSLHLIIAADDNLFVVVFVLSCRIYRSTQCGGVRASWTIRRLRISNRPTRVQAVLHRGLTPRHGRTWWLIISVVSYATYREEPASWWAAKQRRAYYSWSGSSVKPCKTYPIRPCTIRNS